MIKFECEAHIIECLGVYVVGQKIIT